MIGRIWLSTLSSLLKDMSGGWLRPSVYNTILDDVNQDFFLELVKEYEETRVITDVLRSLVVTLGDGDTPPLDVIDGYITLPLDYEYLSSMRLLEYYDSEKPCEQQFNVRGRVPNELTDEQFNSIRDSQLLRPTIKRPKITAQNGKIRVLPENFTKAQISYIRAPKTPFFDWVLESTDEPAVKYLPPGEFHNGSVLPNGTPSRSVDFEFSDMSYSILAEKVLFRASRRLKSDPVVQMTKAR